MIARGAVVVLVALLGACGGDERGAAPDARATPTDTGITRPDAGAVVDGNPGFVPTEPAAPNIPWLDAGPLGPVTSLPVLTPCPPGWREIPPEDELGPATCDPWPEGGMQECADDEAHFPGEPGCTRIGPACPTGDWADDLPTDRRILYVRAGEPPGGDGTRERPLGRIADALAIAVDGDVIALAKGTYDEDVQLTRTVAIWGACVGESVVAPSTPGSGTAAVSIRAPGVEIRRVRVSGVRMGLMLWGLGTLHLEDVVVDGTTAAGIYQLGGTVTGRSVVVRDVAPAESTGALVVESGTTDLERFSFRRLTGIAVQSYGSTVSLRDGIVGDVAPSEDTGSAVGFLVAGPGVVRLERLAVERSDTALVAFDDEPAIRLRDVACRGDSLQLDGDVSLERVLLDRPTPLGLSVVGERARLTARGLVVLAPPTPDRGMASIAIRIARGGFADLAEVVIGGPWTYGLYAEDSAATVSGIVTMGCVTSLLASGSQLDATDLLAVESRVAVLARDASAVTVLRGSMIASGLAAMAVDGGATLEGTDIALARSRGGGDDVSGLYGEGLLVLSSGSVRGRRWSIAESREVGLFASGSGTRVNLEDLRLVATAERRCAESTCVGSGFGYGVGAYDAAEVTLTRFAIADNTFGGLQLANEGTIDLHDGRVAGHVVGANVQSSGFDLTRLFDRVLFHDNDVDIDGSALALPGAPEAAP